MKRREEINQRRLQQTVLGLGEKNMNMKQLKTVY